MRSRWLAPSACAVAVALVAVVLRLQPGGESTARAVDDLAQLLSAGVACAAGIWRSRRLDGRARLSWLLLGVAAGCWATGEAVWSYYELLAGTQTPFPSLADAGFLLFPVLALAGLLLRPSRAFRGRGRRRVGLDSCLIAAALFTVSWGSALGTVYRSGGGAGSLAAVVSLAYPVLDVVLLTLTLVVMTYAARGARSGLLVVSLGLVALAVADSGFAYLSATGAYRTGNLIDVGWIAGFLVVAVGALRDHGSHDVSRDRDDAIPPAVLFVPYVPVVVALAVAAWAAHVDRLDDVSLVAATAMGLLLIARQIVVLADNNMLTARIAHQAFFDSLTGLTNRAVFNDRLTHALDLHRRDMRAVAVLLVDIDDFKTVNDLLGHPAGDELLVRVSERLRATVRTGDTVARLGGDEFAILTEDGGEPLEVAGRVLAGLDQPVAIGDRQVTVRASVGLAALAPDDAPTTGPEILKRADVALYAAKRAGKSTIVRYSADLEGKNAHLLDLRAALAEDLAAGRIDVAYQPVFAAHDGSLQGFEALARWSHDGVTVAPAVFLPLARQLGQLARLDELVLRTAVAQAARWHAGVWVSANIGRESLIDPEFPQRVATALQDAAFPADRLVIEVLETSVIEDDREALRTLELLRALGARISVDDFGAGYASLARLHALEPDIIKVDRSLIAAENDPGGPSPLLTGVAELGHRIGAVVVAEGVETPIQLAAAHAAGCDAVQGFLCGRPTNASGCEDLLLLQRHRDAVRRLG
jgi:diguanylate cyclase (GGDEF)-like protein